MQAHSRLDYQYIKMQLTSNLFISGLVMIQQNDINCTEISDCGCTDAYTLLELLTAFVIIASLTEMSVAEDRRCMFSGSLTVEL